MTMKDVAEQTGVSETTLSRMHNHGRAPDCASMAALSLWAGINPARFSGLVLPKPARDDSIANTRLRGGPPPGFEGAYFLCEDDCAPD